jgi:hypothetical protein
MLANRRNRHCRRLKPGVASFRKRAIMLKIIKGAIVGGILAIISISMPALEAQAQTQNAAPVSQAPVPAQIFSAKKVFISNVGGDNDISPDHYSGGPDRAYNQFYAAMKDWGRYELVSTPADAELIFELHFDVPSVFRPQFRLVILDVKTHVVLWAFTEYLPTYGATHDQSFDRAMAKLVADVQKLAVPPAATSR